MVRAFDRRPVDPDVLDRVLAAGPPGPVGRQHPGARPASSSRARARPRRYWDVTLPAERRADVPLAGPAARAGAGRPVRATRAPTSSATPSPTRPRTGLGDGADGWPVPYWCVDGGMAVMALLLAAVDEGLGALFFGLFDHEAAGAGGASASPTDVAAARHHRPRPPRARRAGPLAAPPPPPARRGRPPRRLVASAPSDRGPLGVRGRRRSAPVRARTAGARRGQRRVSSSWASEGVDVGDGGLAGVVAADEGPAVPSGPASRPSQSGDVVGLAPGQRRRRAGSAR